MDSAVLLMSIKQGLATDPIAQAHLCCLRSCQPHPDSMDDPWMLSKDGEFLLFKGALFVPDHVDVRATLRRGHSYMYEDTLRQR